MSNFQGNGQNLPPGWYRDAQGSMRWWDGNGWTEQVQGVPMASGPSGSNPGSGSGEPWYKMKRWWAVGAVVLLIAIGSAGGGDGDSDSVDVATDSATPPTSSPTASSDSEAESEPSDKSTPKTSKPEEPEEPAEPAEPKVLKVQAGQMLDEFDGNEAAADLKYDGKYLEVTGHVSKVDTELFDDDQYVVMLDGGSPYAFLSVNCNDVSAAQAAKVQVDSTTTVRGTFDDGGDLGVELKDCEVA